VSANPPHLWNERTASAVAQAAAPRWRGRVDVAGGVLVEAAGIPAALGELCAIERGQLGAIEAEVVGFRGASTLLMPFGSLEGIAPGQRVTALGRPMTLPVGVELLGRAIDGFGRPIDGAPAPACAERRAVRAAAPPALERRPITTALQTGVRCIDALATLARGQRLGIFAGSGVGKSSLLAQIARGTDAQVVVVALVGERGREVRAFLDDVLGEAGRRRAVAVVATSDRPPIERYLAPFAAVTAAEWFRDQGLDVLLVMDSATRFALAAREIGLAAGEPPTVRGYPPSFFATVPKLVERMGTAERGSITGLITVLLDGDDPHEPVADTLRGLLDGHVMLTREIASRGHFPAVDVLASLSRLMAQVAGSEHAALAARMRADLAAWREGRDLVEIGAYKPGTNAALDGALSRREAIEAFLRQGQREVASLAETMAALKRIYAPAAGAAPIMPMMLGAPGAPATSKRSARS
jgi:FliI/YscN family ATPase